LHQQVLNNASLWWVMWVGQGAVFIFALWMFVRLSQGKHFSFPKLLKWKN